MKNITLLFVFLLSACYSAAQPSQSSIVLLGDESRIQVAHQCTQIATCKSDILNDILTPQSGADAVEKANLAYLAKHGILVFDATIGPTESIREDILISRQTHLPKLSVWFANTEKLFATFGKKEAEELLNLEVTEMQNLLETYDMSNVTTKFYFGEQGLADVLADSKSSPPMPRNKNFSTVQKVQAAVYNLHQAEQKKSVPLINNNEVKIWISGQTATAKIITEHNIAMAQNADLFLQFSQPVQTQAGERFFIQINQHATAVGFIEKILQ